MPTRPLLRALRCAWGNVFWRADADFLLATLRWWQQTSGTVVECGSGVSTLLLATAAHAHGRRVHALEHDSAWAASVRAAMPRWLASRAQIHHAPMRAYDDFDWYDVGQFEPGPIGLVICDGPPGKSRGGRYGLVPLLKASLAPGAIIVLDDSQRRAEKRVIERWCNELPARVLERHRTHVVLQHSP